MYILSFNLQNLWPLAIMAGIAVIIPILLNVLKLKIIPSLAIEIFAGLILSVIPFTRNMFTESEGTALSPLNEGLYAIGMSILLFLSGIDTDFSVFKKEKKGENKVAINVLIASFVCFFIVLALSVGASFIFINYIEVNNKVLGIALLSIFFSSTFASLVIPLVHDNKLQKTTIGKLIATYSTIAELFSIIALSICLAIKLEGNNFWFLGIIFVLFILMFIIRRFIPIDKLFKDKLEGITHLSTRAVIFIILISILISDIAGLEYILGAFLCGMLLSLLHIKHSFVSKFNAIGYGIFVPIFYMLAGFKVGLVIHKIGYADFFSFADVGLILGIFGIMLAVRIPFMFLAKYYSFKTYIPSIFILTSTIIVALTIEHLSDEYEIFNEVFICAMVIASLVSCIIPPIFFADGKDFGEARDKYKPFILERSDFENLEEHE